MTPIQIAKNSEHSHQAALFAWAAFARHRGFDEARAWCAGKRFERMTEPLPEVVPELKWLHAIPNGANYGDDEVGKRIQGGKMKAEGLRKGVLDILLPVRRGNYSGLYIEMKKPALKSVKDPWNGFSEEQRAFAIFVINEGYGVVACYNWLEAVENIEAYLKWR